MTPARAWLRRLVPANFGGDLDNIWNRVFNRVLGYNCVLGRILAAHDERPFVKLISGLQPRRIMEMGVADGEGAARMIRAASRHDVEYFGFDLFDGRYCKGNNAIAVRQRLEKLGAKIWLFIGDSQKTVPVMLPTLPKMDFIYIDGGHSYEVCKSDWGNAKQLMHPSTVVVFDNYPLRGVKKVVNEIKGYQVGFIYPVKHSSKMGYRRAVVSHSTSHFGVVAERAEK